MRGVSRTLVLCGAIVGLGSAAVAGAGQGRGEEAPVDGRSSGSVVRRAAYQSGRGLSVRWIGQDGHDYVSGSDRHEPDERQDIHLALAGLDPRREVAFMDITLPNGHRWQYNPQPGFWHAHLIRQKGARTADVWVGPIDMGAGIVCHVLVRYDDNTTAEADVRSRKSSSTIRVASASAQAKWVGQDRQDLAGFGTCVGPDGLQDVHIHLSKLSPRYPLKAIRVETAGGIRWEFGQNPQALNNAEFVKDPKDPTQGDLYFQPDRDLSASRLRLTIQYEGGIPDALTMAGGRCDPKIWAPQPPLPKVEEVSLTARWMGQDGGNPARPGDVHVVLGNLPGSGRLAAIAITDTARAAWQFRASDRVPPLLDGAPGSLEVRFRPDRKTADLYFAPTRDTGHDTFSVRMVATDGRNWHGQFPGGPSDLAKVAPMPDSTRAEAHPGDDLQALLDRSGTVILTKGTYRLRHPLVLNRPANLTSSGGATLLFSQDASAAAWKTVIKVKGSNSTLEGFAVRFAGPVRWDWSVSYGPSIIGMTEHTEPGYNDLETQAVFRNLDIESPPVEDPSKWAEAPRLFRLVGAATGAIIGCRLRGGSIECFHGPWQIVDNEYRGTPPGTFSHGFVTGHFTHDLLVRGNRLSSPNPSGKTWRFLVLTGTGAFDRIERNVVDGVGARDDDTIPWMNEPEIILTENYWLDYEGKVLGLSADGKVLRIGKPQGADVKSGDAVAILNGPAAGQWRRVAHVLDSTTVLLDKPMPRESDAVSISHGHIGEVFEGNRIDIRSGKRSDSFVLAGNHYGTRVVDNHLLGGGLAWRMMACPTELPVIWGWSHAPFLGGVVERNVLEDTEQGGVIGVEHSPAIKTNKGRTYMSVQLRDNLVRWTPAFLARRQSSGAKEPLPALVVGYRPSLDPYELVVAASGNVLDAPAGHRQSPGLTVNAAWFNAQKVVDRQYRLPAPGGAPAAGRGEARTGGSRSIR